MKRTVRSLILHKETIRDLSTRQLVGVAGGISGDGCNTTGYSAIPHPCHSMLCPSYPYGDTCTHLTIDCPPDPF